MESNEQAIYERLCRQSKYNVLCDYYDKETLKEVQEEAQLDLQFIENLRKRNPNEYYSIYNLLHAFVWYICYSSGEDEPAGLLEDDFNGFSYFELMKKIRKKFLKGR